MISNQQRKTGGSRTHKRTAAIMAAFVLFSAMPVYAGTPDAPTATVTPSTAATNWTNQSATVSFAIPDYAVTVNQPAAGGTIAVSKNRAVATDTITVTATPDKNYELEYITVNGAKTGTVNFEMPSQNALVSAVFKKLGDFIFDPDAGITGNAYYYRFHGDIEGDSSPSDYTLTKIYPESDNTVTLNWSYTRNATNIGGDAYAYVYQTKEVDLSKYSTLYIDAELLSRQGTTYPRLKLCNFKSINNNKYTQYEILSDKNRNVAQVDLDRTGRQIYTIDVSALTGTIKPMVLNGSDWYSSNTYRHNDSASVKIYKVWFE